MTATQVFKRFLKDNGLYTSYMPYLIESYKSAKEITVRLNGGGYWETQVCGPLLIEGISEKEIMLDAILKLIGYRFIDAIWAVSIYGKKMYPRRDEASKKLYRYAISNLKRYQLTSFKINSRKQLKFEWK